METIIGNMDSTVFLGGKEKTTLKDISDSLGKETIDMVNTSKTYSNQQSHGQSDQKLGRELMSVSELGVMDRSMCIVQISGVHPFLDKKFDITKHHNYKYLSDFDSKYDFDIEAYVNPKKATHKELLSGLPKGIAVDEVIVK